MTETQTETSMAAAPLTAVVDDYLALWNETDAAKRRDLSVRAWGGAPYYADPAAEATGTEALIALVGRVQARYPGHRFLLAGPVDAHHDRAHWAWEFVRPDGGSPVMTGFDVAVLTPEGHLREVIGFFHPTNPA